MREEKKEEGVKRKVEKVLEEKNVSVEGSGEK